MTNREIVGRIVGFNEIVNEDYSAGFRIDILFEECPQLLLGRKVKIIQVEK